MNVAIVMDSKELELHTTALDNMHGHYHDQNFLPSTINS